MEKFAFFNELENKEPRYDGCRIVKIGEKYDIIKVSKNG